MITLRIEAKFLPLFTCAVCGKESRGSTQRVEAFSVQELERKLNHMNPHCMPTGWASYGNQVFKCPEHVT